MLIGDGLLEYIFTIGILVSFLGVVIVSIFNRKVILGVLKSAGFKKSDLIIALILVLVFLAVELYLVKPTQLLFFDDAIYQGMALDFIHMGQAWMCNYGTPLTCFQGQVYHEPIGLSFNIAISFLILGVHRSSAYIAQLVLAAFSVFMTFTISMLLFKNRKVAIFSALIFALTPTILVWAMPTNSDMATLAYSLIAIFTLLIFIKKKNTIGLLTLLLSVSLVMYMKVDALIYIPIFALIYIVLDDSGINKALKSTYKSIKDNILNTKVLLAFLIFVLLIAPSIIYAFSSYSSDGYGYQGSNVPSTCSSTGNYIVATGSINLANFKANICSNLNFWVNAYKNQYVIQPFYFTLLALIGAALMIILSKKRELAALALWFVPIFLLYTAFYAGGVTFGIDWRFMISLMAVPAILGGFALGSIYDIAASKISKPSKRRKSAINAIPYIIAIIMILSLFYITYTEVPLLSIKPSAIQQAGDARFYENFIYNESHLIPSNCIVYTYDPTLFNINNKTATQIDNIYSSSFYSNASAKYSCSVVDIGYWCYTPNNLCTDINSSFVLTNIANATYKLTGNKYSIDYVKPK